LRKPSRRRRFQGIALFVIGVALLVTGVMLPKLAGIPVVSVVGFLLMFFGVLLTVTTIRRGDQTAEVSDEETTRPSRSRSSFSQRMEERFRRRFEDE
jgi:protein-S-isoprenylcysteine O-methyltransferase Ste14